MKRGVLLHNRKPNRIAVSQGDASTSPPSPDIAMTAHAAMVLHASALAFLTREPAVLWLCRHQESREAVQHFQKQVRDQEVRDKQVMWLKVLVCADPLGQHWHHIDPRIQMCIYEDDSNDAYRRWLIKELRWALEQGFTLLEAREYLGLD